MSPYRYLCGAAQAAVEALASAFARPPYPDLEHSVAATACCDAGLVAFLLLPLTMSARLRVVVVP